MAALAAILALVGIQGLIPILAAHSAGAAFAAFAALPLAQQTTLLTLALRAVPGVAQVGGAVAQDIDGVLQAHVDGAGYVTVEFVPASGPGGWGRAPEVRTTWHPMHSTTRAPQRRSHTSGTR